MALTGGEEALAGELVGRYGDAIEVTVGNLTYPTGAGPRREAPPAVPEPVTVQGVEMEVVPDRDVVPVGHVGRATAIVTNRGSARFGPMTAGVLRGRLVDAAGRTVGDTGPQAVTAIGYKVDLDPGEQRELPAVGGTATTDPELGSALPPGRYWLVVSLPLGRPGDAGARELRSRPLPITVIGQ